MTSLSVCKGTIYFRSHRLLLVKNIVNDAILAFKTELSVRFVEKNHFNRF